MRQATGLALALGVAGSALAGDTWVVDRSYLTIAPSSHCAAEVRIFNDPQDTRSKGTDEVTLDGLTVGMSFTLNAGLLAADRFTATPPEGFIAVPPSIDVPDGATATILICSAEGVGA